MTMLSSRYFQTSHLSFFNDTTTTEIYTLSLHDALPISISDRILDGGAGWRRPWSHFRRAAGETGLLDFAAAERSEEHTSELQSRENLVCRLLLEKKNSYVACKSSLQPVI